MQAVIFFQSILTHVCLLGGRVKIYDNTEKRATLG